MAEILEVEARLKDFISQNIKGIEKNLKGFEGKAAAADRKVKKLEGSLASAGAVAKTAFGAFLGVQGIKVLGNFATSTVKLSGKIDGMRMAFDSLGERVGFTDDSLGKLQSATNDAVTEFDLMEQANNALLLGIVKSDDEMAQLFDTAQRLAQAVGKDATFGIESLTTGLGRQSKLMLDNLGIIVNTEKAYKDFAKTLDKTTDELTDQERKTAFLNAGLAAAEEKVDALGKENLTAAQRIDQLNVQMETLKKTIGETLIPIFEAVLPAITKAIGGVRKFIKVNRDFFKLITGNADRFVDTVKTADEKLEVLNAEFVQAFDNRANAIESGNRRAEKVFKRALDRINKEREAIRAQIKDEESRKKTTEKEEEVEDPVAKAREKFARIRDIQLASDEIRRNSAFERNKEEIRLREIAEQKEEESSKRSQQRFIEDAAIKASLQQQRFSATQTFLTGLSQLAATGARQNKGLAVAAKATAIGEATIATFLAANNALASKIPFPFNIAAMTGIIATGLANVAKISAQKFQKGTSFAPGGLALVGERGPELLNVPRGARIQTAAETREITNNTSTVTNNKPTVVVINAAEQNISDALEKAVRDRTIDMSRILTDAGVSFATT